MISFQNGNCSCKKGYYGDRCQMKCLPGRYGNNCEQTCHCNNNQSCDPENGRCYLRCAQGRMGDSCDQGEEAVTSGDCRTQEFSFVWILFCVLFYNKYRFLFILYQIYFLQFFLILFCCTFGWCGVFLLVCPRGTFGFNCEEKCNCHNSNCHPETGECICKAGTRGRHCNKRE